jgi:hypothetical protein
MAQEREAVTSVVQSRLLKIIEATKKMKQADAQWLLEHAVDKDLLTLAGKIQARAKAPDAE